MAYNRRKINSRHYVDETSNQSFIFVSKYAWQKDVTLLAQHQNKQSCAGPVGHMLCIIKQGSAWTATLKWHQPTCSVPFACRFKPITTNTLSLIARPLSIVTSAPTNITVYVKPVFTFGLWDSLPIIVYPKPGVTLQIDLDNDSGCSTAESHHYQVYGELAAGFDIDTFNVTIPYIDKPVGGLGRPVLPFANESTLIG